MSLLIYQLTDSVPLKAPSNPAPAPWNLVTVPGPLGARAPRGTSADVIPALEWSLPTPTAGDWRALLWGFGVGFLRPALLRPRPHVAPGGAPWADCTGATRGTVPLVEGVGSRGPASHQSLTARAFPRQPAPPAHTSSLDPVVHSSVRSPPPLPALTVSSCVWAFAIRSL